MKPDRAICEKVAQFYHEAREQNGEVEFSWAQLTPFVRESNTDMMEAALTRALRGLAIVSI